MVNYLPKMQSKKRFWQSRGNPLIFNTEFVVNMTSLWNYVQFFRRVENVELFGNLFECIRM